MSIIALIDTTVFLNILDVPGFNQHREEVLKELKELKATRGANLLLPLATIIESGNHISHLSDGKERRRYAELFIDEVRASIDGGAPWTPIALPDKEIMASWLKDFPEYAMQGLGIGDASIIKQWQAACDRHIRSRVKIWSLDKHLNCYDRVK